MLCATVGKIVYIVERLLLPLSRVRYPNSCRSFNFLVTVTRFIDVRSANLSNEGKHLCDSSLAWSANTTIRNLANGSSIFVAIALAINTNDILVLLNLYCL